MKKFEEYTITSCTAIALCDESREDHRQPALLVSTTLKSGEKVEHVVFGWEMPADMDEWRSMCEDSAAWESVSDEHKEEVIE